MIKWCMPYWMIHHIMNAGSWLIWFDQVFLDGLAATMKADADFKGGWYDPQKPPTLGPRAFARVYAGWGLSQPFYWEQVSQQHFF